MLVSHDPAAATVADRVVTIRDGRVAAEAVRTAEGGGDTIVVGRGGWLRLPEEYLRRAGIVTHATARLEHDEIVVRATGPVDKVPGTLEGSLEGLRREEPGVVAELRHVSKGYGRREVLRDLDASFRGGTLTAVTGPSGSGKTTLLHLLAGLELPSSGDVVVQGTVFSALDRAARAELRAGTIAFVGQEPGLTPFLSARENVELGQALHTRHRQRRRPGALRRRSLRASRPARLAALDRRARPGRDRPRARRQRRLILVDEPTSRLDQRTRSRSPSCSPG